MTPVLMWEVRAAEGREDELLRHVLETAAPQAQVFRSADSPPRIVVLDPTGLGVPNVPAELVARPPHQWRFEPVDRTREAAADAAET
jgi:hypothetical protein